ncbi:2-hydroxyacid dehydrogenase [bacterium]|nr:2-hydroxyacid dehydrogenase [bacterium]
MKTVVFSTKQYDREYFDTMNKQFNHELKYFEARMSPETMTLAEGYPAVCAFVHDHLDQDVINHLAGKGLKLIALRCAGFNNVDLKAAETNGVTVTRVPAYSPKAVAEYTIGMIMALNRKYHRAYNRVREGNFALDGLIGFNLCEKAVGILGTGKIGIEVARILNGFGCRILGYDPSPHPDCEKLGVELVDLDTLFTKSDIITLHCPLLKSTERIINRDAIHKMRDGVMLINTSRGALIDTVGVIDALKSKKIGFLGLDVYEEEEKFFFEDLSQQVIEDDVLARLLTFPNVLVTGHQAFFTKRAMHEIAETTLSNMAEYERTGTCQNVVERARTG